MSVTLAVRDGRPCVEIVDHAGECWCYAFEVLANTPERFSVRLRKIDDPAAPTYLVQIGRAGNECDCKDQQCRRRFVGERCKHLSAAHGLRKVLSALWPVGQERAEISRG